MGPPPGGSPQGPGGDGAQVSFAWIPEGLGECGSSLQNHICASPEPEGGAGRVYCWMLGLAVRRRGEGGRGVRLSWGSLPPGGVALAAQTSGKDGLGPRPHSWVSMVGRWVKEEGRMD